MDDSRLSLRQTLLFLIAAAIPLLALFYHSPDVAIQDGDAPAAWFQNMHSALAGGFWNLWSSGAWLGERYAPISPDFNAVLLRWTDFPFSLNLLFSLNLFVGGIGMFALLRSLKLAGSACVLGGLAYLLSNTILTLVYPGHVNKVMSCAWLPFSVAAFLTALRDNRLGCYAISGAFLGLSLLAGEVQVPYYLGLWYVAWLLLFLWNQWGLRQLGPRVAVKHSVGLLLVVICALGLGFSTAVHSLSYLGGTPPLASAAAPENNWRFATQFYFPPEEILSYLTTVQFFGGPHVYWGRDGNPTPLRLSDDYMGLLPLGFAILGGIVCWRIWQARLFVIMGIGSLLASFGREGGLYWLLYQLPTMKSQRNPHRWSYFVSLAVCVLAAYGVDWLVKRVRQARIGKGKIGEAAGEPPAATRESPALPDPKSRAPDWVFWQRCLLWVVFTSALLFAVAGILWVQHRAVAEAYYGKAALLSEMGPLFLERTRMLLGSLTRTGCFLALSTGSVWWVIAAGSKFKVQSSKFWTLAPWTAIVLVLILDLGLNARRYIHFYNWRDYYDKNGLANFLRQDTDFYRVKVFGIHEHPMLNELVSNILPFHRIPVIDPPSVSRMPRDYNKLFAYIREHPVMRTDRYLDLFNVKYILSPQPFSDEYVNFTRVAEWNGIHVTRRDDFMPRAWLVETARVVRDGEDAVLLATLHPAMDLREIVVLEEAPRTVPVDSQKPLGNRSGKLKDRQPSTLNPQPSPATRSARISRYEDNRVEIVTSADRPAMLVLGEKWDADWKAWTDGNPTRIYRANFLMRAVEVPSGSHTILMEYRPSLIPFWISVISVSLFCLGGIKFLFKQRNNSDKKAC